MADPLSVLRNFAAAGRTGEVTLPGDGRVYFADQYSFPKSAYTAFKSSAGDFYDLEAVVYFIRLFAGDEKSRLVEYINGCKQQNIGLIAVVDRRPLRDYLLGLRDAASLPNLSEAAPVAAPAEPEGGAKRQRADEPEVDPLEVNLRQLKKQERQLRDRNSMLLAPGGKTFKEVLDLVERAQRQDALAAKQAAAAAAAAARAAAKQPGQAAFYKPSGRLERDTRAETARALGQAEELGLGYGEPALPGSQQQQQQQRPPPPPPSAQQQQQQQQRRPSGRPSAPAPAARPAAAAAAGAGAQKKRGGGVPIILVPAGMSALVNIYNARQLLEEGVFVRSQDAMADNPSKPEAITIRRTVLRDKPVPYVVKDKPPAKTSSEWKRVVAVIVQGKAWQFKDYPFPGADKGNLVDTFQKVLGVYLHYSDERPPDAVRSWNVRTIPIQRDGRHLDAAALLELYKALDAFLAARRCELEY